MPVVIAWWVPRDELQIWSSQKSVKKEKQICSKSKVPPRFKKIDHLGEGYYFLVLEVDWTYFTNVW